MTRLKKLLELLRAYRTIKKEVPMSVLSGLKTYLVAIGLVGLAAYQFSTGDYSAAMQSLLAGLAAFGLRMTVAKLERQ